MDMNYLVQRKINAQKKQRRKVILTVALSVILLILVIAGLIKILHDEKNDGDGTKDGNSKVSENLTPGAEPDSAADQNGLQEGNENSDMEAEATPLPTEEPVPTEAPVQIPETTKKVAIDAGHGGEDLGSTRQGLYEKDANLQISQYLKQELENAGYTVYMVRETDMELELESRPAKANEQKVDLYISIHLNSLEGDSDATRGAEVWYSELRDDNSKLLAQYVIDEMTAMTGAKNRGVKLSNKLVVLKYNEAPACLVECGFITSETERTMLFDPEYQQKIAEGICNGIKKFLPLE